MNIGLEEDVGIMWSVKQLRQKRDCKMQKC